MATEMISKSCAVILEELKYGQFTREDLEFLQRFFQKIADTTKGMLSPNQLLDSDGKKPPQA